VTLDRSFRLRAAPICGLALLLIAPRAFGAPPACPPGEFDNGSTCVPCSSTCYVGTGIDGYGGAPCGPASDTSCGPCMPGTFNDGTAQTCSPCSSCAPGTYNATSCLPTQDTVCAACDPSCTTCSGPAAFQCSSCPTGDAPGSGVCGCSAAPWGNCRFPGTVQKSTLTIKNNADPTKDVIKWKWAKGSATDVADFGNPTTTDSYFLCVYDNGARVSSSTLPIGGTCAGKPCWAMKETGFVYKDKDGTPDGVVAAKLQAGVFRKALVQVLAKGALVETPDPGTLTGPIRVQLQRQDRDICFEADFSAPFKKNKSGTLSDTSD
jgi:hypothetical protein